MKYRIFISSMQYEFVKEWSTNTETKGTNRTRESVCEKFISRRVATDVHGTSGSGQPFVLLHGSVVSSGMMSLLKGRMPSYYKLRCRLEKDGTIVNGTFTTRKTWMLL